MGDFAPDKTWKIILGVDFGKRIPYAEQSGALNESYADIFGAIIDNKNSDGFYQKSEDSGDLFYDIPRAWRTSTLTVSSSPGHGI